MLRLPVGIGLFCASTTGRDINIAALINPKTAAIKPSGSGAMVVVRFMILATFECERWAIKAVRLDARATIVPNINNWRKICGETDDRRLKGNHSYTPTNFLLII